MYHRGHLGCVPNPALITGSWRMRDTAATDRSTIAERSLGPPGRRWDRDRATGEHRRQDREDIGPAAVHRQAADPGTPRDLGDGHPFQAEITTRLSAARRCDHR